jgi:hypothetical protein
MSQLESGAMGAATLALNFIPGIGPFLSAGAALAESLLGGGDPTPEWQLETQVMQMREQIALAHRQLGIADSFPIPLPDAKGPEHIPTLQAAVTEANGGPVSGNDWRQGLYTAIHNLQGELQQISQQSNNQQVVAQVLAALHQSPVLPGAAQPAPDPAGSLPQGQAPAQAAASTFGQEAAQVGPWALGGAALVVVLLLAMGSGAKKAAA